MKQKFFVSILMFSALFLFADAIPAEGSARIGGGIHYLRTVGDIGDDDGFDENSLGFMGSLVAGDVFRVEADVEFIPDFGGTDKTMWQPQAYAMLGQPLYAGVGIGIGNFDGEWQDNPFYALRAGFNMPFSGMDIDLFGSYRFQKDKSIGEFTSDDFNSITFGALLRFGGSGLR